MSGQATAIAHANIALAKYWGKSERGENRTAVPSLSMTLGALSTKTRVRFAAELGEDRVELGGTAAEGRVRERVVRLLDEIRRRAGIGERAEVASHNDFPTASGLASSASGFAALAMAAQAAAGLELPLADVSAIARRASASAARSIYPGFVELLADAESAAPVAAADWLDVRMLVALATTAPKDVGSTDGMRRTQASSPYYAAWIAAASLSFAEVKRALLARDLPALGEAMEHSTLAMHASAFAARPPVVYWKATTLALMERVRELRAGGIPAYFTMDAGPHVKVLTRTADAPRVRAALAEVAGVAGVLESEPGSGAELVDA